MEMVRPQCVSFCSTAIRSSQEYLAMQIIKSVFFFRRIYNVLQTAIIVGPLRKCSVNVYCDFLKDVGFT